MNMGPITAVGTGLMLLCAASTSAMAQGFFDQLRKDEWCGDLKAALAFKAEAVEVDTSHQRDIDVQAEIKFNELNSR